MLSTGWTASMRDEPFDRHQPVRRMNGRRLSMQADQRSDLERVFLIGCFDRTAPWAMEFLQHLLGRSASGIDNALQRLEVTALLTAQSIGAAAPPRPRMRQHHTSPRDFQQIAVTAPAPED